VSVDLQSFDPGTIGSIPCTLDHFYPQEAGDNPAFSYESPWTMRWTLDLIGISIQLPEGAVILCVTMDYTVPSLAYIHSLQDSGGIGFQVTSTLWRVIWGAAAVRNMRAAGRTTTYPLFVTVTFTPPPPCPLLDVGGDIIYCEPSV
jgi:hypothetical protein